MAPVEELVLLDIDRSNKGASKQRRDQINAEINVMRDLLPLPASSRQRLSQLQIMSLSCVYIRKCNVLQKLFRCQSHEQILPDSLDFFQALTGFLLVMTREGKLMYISENVTDFLGHSMVDMKTQGDSFYDIVDKRDHGTVQAQLLQGGAVDLKDVNEDVSFFCRMNMSRTLKRQSSFGDVKVMHVCGHFVHVNNSEAVTGNTNESQYVFMASCSPLITPDLKENLVQNNTMVFKTVHRFDMTFVEVTKMAEYHLGFTSEEMSKRSWYSMLHPEDIHEAKEKHTQLIRSNHEMGCMMTVRMLNADGNSIWLNIVMHVRQSSHTHTEEPYIVCTNQVISAQEAYQIKMQAQMFSFYPGRVQEMWGNHVTNTATNSASGNQWAQQNGNIPALVPGYQNGIPLYVSQPNYHHSYHSVCSPNQILGQSGKHPMGVTQTKMSSVVHTDQLKAMLKRKIQGPGMSCRPMKIPKVSWDNNGQEGHEFSEMGHMMHHDDHHNLHAGNSGGRDHQNESVQVMHLSNYRYGVLQAKKVHKSLRRSQALHQAHHIIPGNISQMCQEQVVPDVNVPESFLTPDPSPVSSPQPSQSMGKMETRDSEEMRINGKSSVSFLQALEKLASFPQGNMQVVVPPNNSARCPPQLENPSSNSVNKKELPTLNAFDIINFFETLDIPEKSSKVSVKVEDKKLIQKIKTEIPLSPKLALKNVPCLPEIKKEIPCYSPPMAFQTCNSPSNLTEILTEEIQDGQMMSDVTFPKVKLEEPSLMEEKLDTPSCNSEILRFNNKDLVLSSMMHKSPASVGSQETFAGTESLDILSCFSDDGLDLSPLQTDPRSNILDSSLSESMPIEQFDIIHKKFYASDVPAGQSRHQAPEELSPLSSTSSLAGEDEFMDNPSTWSTDMALGALQSHDHGEIGGQCNIKDQEVLGMESGFSQMDMFFNSRVQLEGSLDLSKHSQ